MKKISAILIIGLLLVASNTFAADGDLIVTGKVGIGTTTLVNKVQIEGTGQDHLKLKNTGTAAGSLKLEGGGTGAREYWLYSTGQGNAAGAGKLVMGVDGNMHVTLDASGNVGVGTTTPGAKLEVNGDIKVPMMTQWCTYGASPGNPTCTCPTGYYALDCGRNHYNPATLINTGTGCYAETINGYTDSASSLVVRCAKIHE